MKKMNKIKNKYELAKIFCNKLNVFNWDTQKNKINRKIDEIIMTSNSEKEVKEAIKEIKENYKFNYSIYPIYTQNQYAKEIKKYGLIIE